MIARCIGQVAWARQLCTAAARRMSRCRHHPPHLWRMSRPLRVRIAALLVLAMSHAPALVAQARAPRKTVAPAVAPTRVETTARKGTPLDFLEGMTSTSAWIEVAPRGATTRVRYYSGRTEFGGGDTITFSYRPRPVEEFQDAASRQRIRELASGNCVKDEPVAYPVIQILLAPTEYRFKVWCDSTSAGTVQKLRVMLAYVEDSQPTFALLTLDDFARLMRSLGAPPSLLSAGPR